MTDQPDTSRFLDPGLSLYDMMGEIFVICPRCNACARITTVEPGSRDWFAPRRLTCLHCSYVGAWAEKEIRRGWWDRPVVDDFFGAQLWLQAPCCNDVLWAYNLRHLKLIESYVRAKLRKRTRHPLYGWSNGSLLNRLPRWISAAKNRDAVLKTIEQLPLPDSIR